MEINKLPKVRAAAVTYFISADPSSPGGVPTAINWIVPTCAAFSTSVVTCDQRSTTLRRTIF